jgi:hypothetical protein
MANGYARTTVSFGFSSGFPRDVVALLAVLAVTFVLQAFETTARLLDLLRLTPRVWASGWVWQLLTYPFVAFGLGIGVALELLFLFFFARDVFARLGRRWFWQTLLVGSVSGGAVALLVDFAARRFTGVSPYSLYLVQGQHMVFAVVAAAFAALYRDATVMVMLVLPLRARWILFVEVIVAFVFLLQTRDLAGFVGICAALGVTWTTLGRGGFRGLGRESWLRAQSWWLRRRMDRLRRKRGFHVVDDGRRDPWLH